MLLVNNPHPFLAMIRTYFLEHLDAQAAAFAGQSHSDAVAARHRVEYEIAGAAVGDNKILGHLLRHQSRMVKGDFFFCNKIWR